MGSEKAVLSAADYILFILMLLVSAGIGLYFKFSGGKQTTTDEFLLAGKNMSILPVAFSIMASYLSAIAVIGVPAEVYMFGIHMVYFYVSYPIGVVIASYVCLPVFFKSGECTAFEMLYMAVVLYAPALALSAVTNVSIWTSVISVGVVCMFYCTLGGMKAVLWTDLFQAMLMFIGIFAIVIKGFSDIGFSEVFRIGYEEDRIAIPTLSPSLTERYTVWNLLIQGCIYSLMTFGATQIQIKRLLTLKNISRSRMALYLSIPLNVLFYILACVAGLVIYAHFYKCDPLTASNKPISAADQLLPFYIIKVLGGYPGLPGLCICGVFAAALSTVSSGLNSLSSVTMQDLGALIGLVLGLCTTSWITFGTFTSGARPKILPLSSENCQANSTLFSRISSSTLMSMLPETSTLSTASVPKINTETP
ncbi:unnamed protein product [Larinioides sclopetarius]|uniref:Sodium-dependent multivitamin transporter n=1 Tax=Larinioides sclopetarius TaxID=280406 RepID=A0AAV2BY97_9ARAC